MLTTNTHAAFQTTRWTLVDRLRLGSDDEQQEALGALARLYWPPVYAVLRAKGMDRARAEELAQDFFVRIGLERGLFTNADQHRGTLRSLVRASLENYLIDGHRREVVRRSTQAASLDDLEREEDLLASVRGLAPEAVFDQRLAMSMVEEALDRCRLHFEAKDKVRNWRVFHARKILPALGASGAIGLEQAAREFGFASAADAAAAVQTVTRRFETILREIFFESGDNPDNLSDARGIVTRWLGV